MDINEFRAAIANIDDWLDEGTSQQYKDQPLAQDTARVAKASEEAGEAFEAFLGYTGQNPRKGFHKELGDVLDELADVAITGVLGIQHFTKDSNYTVRILVQRIQYRLSKMPEGYR